MNKERIKVIIAWILLIILIAALLYINHVKFFRSGLDNTNIDEIPVENSTSEAINSALTEIVNKFNTNPLIEQYKNKGISLNASLNNYSIYITYTTDTTTTYEFLYSNLTLKINITNTEDNKNKFNQIYEILIKASQQRIKNEANINNIITNHLNNNINYDGLTKEINNDTIQYNMNITKKLKEERSE